MLCACSIYVIHYMPVPSRNQKFHMTYFYGFPALYILHVFEGQASSHLFVKMQNAFFEMPAPSPKKLLMFWLRKHV